MKKVIFDLLITKESRDNGTIFTSFRNVLLLPLQVLRLLYRGRCPQMISSFAHHIQETLPLLIQLGKHLNNEVLGLNKPNTGINLLALKIQLAS